MTVVQTKPIIFPIIYHAKMAKHAHCSIKAVRAS